MDGKWLSILEYASYKSKSISTVRRCVKANRVKYREENGKYFIWVKNYVSSTTSDERAVLESKLELERLKKENRELKNDVSEMRMLIQLYESGHMLPKTLPESPVTLS